MSEQRAAKGTNMTTIKNIIGNYEKSEKALIDQLYFKASHGPTIGGFREDIWRGLFELIVPKKFVIEQSVFIIDSEGRVSSEVDLAVFDETYTPYIFRYGRLKFLPIEAVAVAIECKSSSMDQNRLKQWAESVAALKTSCKSYARIYGTIATGKKTGTSSRTQTATRPLRILCCLNENVFNKKLDNQSSMFDFIIRAPEKANKLTIECNPEYETLQDWYKELNHAGTIKDDCYEGNEIKDITLKEYEVNTNRENVSLLTFNLQLNQLLMLINNPMPFPHISYAEMFNKAGEEGD